MTRGVSSLFKTKAAQQELGFAWLYEIYVNPTTTLYFTSNLEDINFDGQIYTSYNIKFDRIPESAAGAAPTLQMTIGNVDRVMSAYLFNNNGLRGNEVRLILVFITETDGVATVYDDPNSKLEIKFYVTAAGGKPQGSSRIIQLMLKPKLAYDNEKIPRRKMRRSFCWWRYRSRECGYTGPQMAGPGGAPDDYCSRILGDSVFGCSAHINIGRFGGYPSMPAQQTIRLQ